LRLIFSRYSLCLAQTKSCYRCSAFGVSNPREPANLPEGIRGEASTLTAADAAELDALYHDLPSYQPEPVSGKEVEETVITESILLSTISVSEMPVVSPMLPILITRS